jgi:hypothetical protein
MQELINSVARLSAAMTLFGMQEMQKLMGAALDTPPFLNRFSASLDSISNAIVAELDPDTKPALDSVTSLGREVVDRTFETLRTPAFDPRQVLKATSDVIRKTADAMGKPAPQPAASTEPKPAEEVLTGK